MNKILVTAAMLLVFGTSAYMSVYGLTAVFTGSLILVALMGAGMELGKVLTIVHLHRNWRRTELFSKCFFILVIGALTLITSAEIMGFLSQQHTNATRDLVATETRLRSLDQEVGQLKSQITVIDQTLEGLPVTFVTKRFREREAAGYAEKQNRLLEVSRLQSELKDRYIANQAYSGPIFAASRIMGLDEQTTISIFILVLVLVLEPLSVGLTIATSSAWRSDSDHDKNVMSQDRDRSKNEKLMAVSKTAGRTAETATAAPKTAKTAGRFGRFQEVAEKTAETAHPNTIELVAIKKRHNLKIKDLKRITKRKQPETVAGWLVEKPVIPIKALRLVRRWERLQPAVRLVKNQSVGAS